MQKYLIATVIAFGALFVCSSVQAAPLNGNKAAIQSLVAESSATETIHYRYGWRRAYGSRQYWRNFGWQGYTWGLPFSIGDGYACRLRCNHHRQCWRVCW